MARSIFLIIVLIVTSGCASITRGTTEAYAIQSDPVGATARLSTGLSCQTPCSVKVKRRGDFTVIFEKEGYEPVTATVTSSVDGAGAAGMAGNVILGGIIGAGVDAGTGAMHSHKPNPLVVKMIRVGDSNGSSTQPGNVIDSGTDPLGILVGGDQEDTVPEEEQIDPLDMSQE